MAYTGYTPPEIELRSCHICSTKLLPNPLYDETVSKYCPHHGDFFVIRLRGEAPSVVFKAFEIHPTDEAKEEKAPRAKKEKARRAKKIKEPPRVRPPRVKTAEERKWYIPMPKPQKRPGHPGINVRCDQTGVIFATIKEAAKTMGLDQTSIVNVLRGKQRAALGYTFTKMDGEDNKPFVPKPRLPIVRVSSSSAKQPIRCDQTGVIFESILQAARKMGLKPANISKQINGHQSAVHGYTFTKIEKEQRCESPE